MTIRCAIDALTTVDLIALLFGVVAVLGAIAALWKYAKSAKQYFLEREEEKKTIQRLADHGIECTKNEAIKEISEELLDVKAGQDQLKAGVRELLAVRVETMATEAIEKGYLYQYEYEGVKRLYDAYHAMGGNGYLTAIVKKVDGLPIRAMKEGL